MSNQMDYWNKTISSLKNIKPRYDHWLYKYDDILKRHRDYPILELGCGWGDDTLYLIENGYKVLSCDFSIEALNKINEYIPSAKTIQMDFLKGLPFDDGSIHIVLADLCLHYFRWEDTIKVINDINRVLTLGGYLFCRVNSTRDINYEAMQGEKIEDNYYLVNGCTKRSFDKGSIDELFKDWKIEYIKEYTADKYHKPKVVWEIAAAKLIDKTVDNR